MPGPFRAGPLAALLLAAAPVLAQDVTVVVTSNHACALMRGDEEPTTRLCSACHDPGRHSHPVDVDYASAARPEQSELRPPAEVARRGVRLVDGKIACVTCHDARSKFAGRLAIPSDALVRPPVKLDDPKTFEETILPGPASKLPEGSAVSPTPLCKSCHAFD